LNSTNKLPQQILYFFFGYILPYIVSGSRINFCHCHSNRDILRFRLVLAVGPDSSVGIVARYGLDGQGIESRWNEISRTLPHRPWDPPILLYSGYKCFFLGCKAAGAGVNHLTPSNIEIKETVEPYLYVPSGPSWPVLRRTSPLPCSCYLTQKAKIMTVWPYRAYCLCLAFAKSRKRLRKGH
jgi:hypothetical protein